MSRPLVEAMKPWLEAQLGRIPNRGGLAKAKDVLERVVDGHPVSRLDDLLPWNWTPRPVNP